MSDVHSECLPCLTFRSGDVWVNPNTGGFNDGQGWCSLGMIEWAPDNVKWELGTADQSSSTQGPRVMGCLVVLTAT